MYSCMLKPYAVCDALFQILNKVIDDEPKAPEKRLYDLRIELLHELKWAIWVKQHERWNVVRFPSSFTLF